MKTLALRARVFIHCFLVFGYPGETLALVVHILHQKLDTNSCFANLRAISNLCSFFYTPCILSYIFYEKHFYNRHDFAMLTLLFGQPPEMVQEDRCVCFDGCCHKVSTYGVRFPPIFMLILIQHVSVLK